MRLGLVAVALALLAGCAKPPRYDWGRYEDSLYQYYKDPATAGRYLEELAKLSQTGDADGRIAPGVHAEYGYMLLSKGRKAEAIREFEREKKSWPEATLFMDQMIAVASGGSRPATAASAPPLAGKVGS